VDQEQYFTSVNEDWRGNYTLDQAIILEDDEKNEESYIFMTRAYSSLYEFERGLANLVTSAHMDYLLDDDFDEKDLNFQQLYR